MAWFKFRICVSSQGLRHQTIMLIVCHTDRGVPSPNGLFLHMNISMSKRFKNKMHFNILN